MFVKGHALNVRRILESVMCYVVNVAMLVIMMTSRYFDCNRVSVASEQNSFDVKIKIIHNQ